VPSIDNEVNYLVVFMGEIITGFTKEQVISKVSHITRMTPEVVAKKFFRKEPCRLIIKSTPDLEKAKKYHGKFSRAGMAVGIQMDFKED